MRRHPVSGAAIGAGLMLTLGAGVPLYTLVMGGLSIGGLIAATAGAGSGVVAGLFLKSLKKENDPEQTHTPRPIESFSLPSPNHPLQGGMGDFCGAPKYAMHITAVNPHSGLPSTNIRFLGFAP